MAKFTVTLHEIVAHTFTVDALDQEAATRLAYARFDAQLDSDTCLSLGLDLARSRAVDLAAKKADQLINRATKPGSTRH